MSLRSSRNGHGQPTMTPFLDSPAALVRAQRPHARIWEHWTGIDGAGDGFNLVNDFLVTRSTSFELIGHLLFALLFAYLGGLTARRFAKLGATPAAVSR